jgi:hypothetical protein
MAIEWIKRQTTIDNMGIQWTFTKQLQDLNFADDVDIGIVLVLHSSKLQHVQTKLSKLAAEAKKTINRKNTEVINK